MSKLEHNDGDSIYDIALSFAGEDREIAEQIANLLQNRGIKVFYDKFEQATLWGKNLYDYLEDIYTNRARYCVILISSSYAQEAWTRHERRSAQARAFQEYGEYILPVRLDDTSIPGLPETVAYVDYRNLSIEKIVDLIIEKLRNSGSRSETSLSVKSQLQLSKSPRPEAMGLAQLNEIKTQLDKRAKQKAHRILWYALCALIIVWIALAILTYFLTWEVMEPWTYFIGGGATLISIAYFVITLKEFSPRAIYEQLIVSEQNRLYQEAGFDVEKYEALRHMRAE